MLILFNPAYIREGEGDTYKTSDDLEDDHLDSFRYGYLGAARLFAPRLSSLYIATYCDGVVNSLERELCRKVTIFQRKARFHQRNRALDLRVRGVLTSAKRPNVFISFFYIFNF